MPRAIPELSIQSSERRACPLDLIFYWVETDYHSKLPGLAVRRAMRKGKSGTGGGLGRSSAM